jgi:adenine-specific DNA glycosylase
LIVQTGKQHCRPKNPNCTDCPLKEFLPIQIAQSPVKAAGLPSPFSQIAQQTIAQQTIAQRRDSIEFSSVPR